MPETTLITNDPKSDPAILRLLAQSNQLRDYAMARIIATNDDLKPATEDLTLIAKLKKTMEAKRKDYLAPFQDHVKQVNEDYKTLMAPVEDAEKITKQKILTFQSEQLRKRQEAEAIEAEKLALARREAELNGGEITVDLTPVAKPDAAPTRVVTDMGTTGTRDNWKWEVIDLNLVPREYLMVNVGMLTPIVKASKGKLTIPGVRIFNEPIIAVNSK